MSGGFGAFNLDSFKQQPPSSGRTGLGVMGGGGGIGGSVLPAALGQMGAKKKISNFYEDDPGNDPSLFFSQSMFQPPSRLDSQKSADFGLGGSQPLGGGGRSTGEQLSQFTGFGASSLPLLGGVQNSVGNVPSSFGSIGLSGLGVGGVGTAPRGVGPQSNAAQQPLFGNRLSGNSVPGFPGNPTSNNNALSLSSLGLSNHHSDFSNLGFPSSQPGGQISPNRGLIGSLQPRGGLGGSSVGPGGLSQGLSTVGMPSKSTGFTGSGNTFSGFGIGQGRPFQSVSGGAGGVFGGPGLDSPSLSLDLSEFPALNNRARRDSGGSTGSHGGLPGGRQPYNTSLFLSKPQEPTVEFQIQQEDFPALPGSAAAKEEERSDKPNGSSSSTLLASENSSPSQSAVPVAPAVPSCPPEQNRGIKTYPDGRVTSIPRGMVTDQFGIVGLLTFIRAAENDASLVQLALGSDLTSLGLNLNSPENLFSTFQSPFAETPCRPQDIDFHVPSEYLTNVHIREKLAGIKLMRYGEDLLFYLFYTNGGDVLQLAAAAELYNRDWRFHKEEKVWITRAPGMDPQVKTTTFERGTYFFFDWPSWRKVAKEFHLDYDKLEDRPSLPTSLANYHPAHAQVMAATH